MTLSIFGVQTLPSRLHLAISPTKQVQCLEKPLESSKSSSSSIAHDSYDSTLAVQGHPLSTWRLLFAHIGAAMTLFLATTDSTIVSTSLPTITNDLRASQSQYTWVGVAYMLTQTACQPLYGRISDLVGRKNLLYSSMIIFATGSLLCGVAKSILWLIIARGVAGLGGGGIVSSVWVITSEIVEPQNRAKWSQALSVTWSCSAIAGPLLGGFFSSSSSTISWRWAFYLNLPVCLVAFVILSMSLRHVPLGRADDASWRSFGQRFDFIGLLLFMAGTSSVVVGFSFAETNGWTSVSTLLLITLGPAVLIAGGLYEVFTTRDALFPATIFRQFSIIAILVVTFLHNFAFTAGTFYLALYYQLVNGATPLQAGVQMLPYSLGSSLASVPAAWFIGFCQKRTKDTSGQKWITCGGLIISTLGFGLMNLLHERSSHVSQAVYPLISGVGLGMLFHAPYQIFTRALKPSELATGTSAFFLVRFTGATVGLAVAGNIFYGHLSHGISSNYVSSSTIDWKPSSSAEPLRSEVLHGVSLAIQAIWTVCAPCLGGALVLSVFLKRVPVEEAVDLAYDLDKSSTDSTPVN